MAVDVEAEVSATKRSQVEVTKIFPEWKEGKKNKYPPIRIYNHCYIIIVKNVPNQVFILAPVPIEVL